METSGGPNEREAAVRLFLFEGMEALFCYSVGSRFWDYARWARKKAVNFLGGLDKVY